MALEFTTATLTPEIKLEKCLKHIEGKEISTKFYTQANYQSRREVEKVFLNMLSKKI